MASAVVGLGGFLLVYVRKPQGRGVDYVLDDWARTPSPALPPTQKYHPLSPGGSERERERERGRGFCPPAAARLGMGLGEAKVGNGFQAALWWAKNDAFPAPPPAKTGR